MNRWKDWWDQGERDLRHARHSLEDGDYEWSAFASQQAAEKALKALILSQGGEPWGYSISGLVEALPPGIATVPDLMETANRLDKHYIPARYPNGFAAGYPGSFTRAGRRRARFRMVRRSLSSAGAVYLDRASRIDELRAAARRAAVKVPSVQRVILFGSLVAGIPTP
jgi:HEPN domain-containing protein